MMEADTKAHHLLENINTAILVFDNALNLSCINVAAENLLSVSSRKVTGLNVSKVLAGASDFVDLIRRSVTARQPYTERGFELKLNDSRSITVDYMVTPLFNGESCQEIIVELNNAHSLSRAMREENLSNIYTAAQESLRGIAHEIKNPLGGLRGAAQLLERELSSEELKEYTQIIINEADRLHNLVDRMITPSDSLNLSAINIHEILEYVQNLVEAESPTPLHIERDYDPSLPHIEVDREQMIQAFLNIVRNAMQAIDKDGHIWVQTRIKRMYTIRQQLYKLVVQIEIIDNGPGVPAEIENSIFYPMVTGRAEGMGLGLSIAQSLIQSQGGLIEHERDNGTTVFRILLPVR